MARIAGVDLPREKRVEIGLTYIYGIGINLSKQILQGHLFGVSLSFTLSSAAAPKGLHTAPYLLRE